MSEWQPIATAPKDGTAVLVYGPGMRPEDSGYSIAVWNDNAAMLLMGKSGFSAMVAGWIAYSDSQIDIESQPTHWMPLPAPPTD
jgi:hypothetical protein